ncbi:MAG: polyprenyl synthetase family protein [Candidatus Sericytochromatia bacterium]
MLNVSEIRMKQAQQEIERALADCLAPSAPAGLWDAMAYSVMGGGKRFRPLLCLFSCEAIHGTWQAALPAACAVELIHTYSLIHDDLPALDNDDWRRGKPSNHKAHGEDMAILAGDALLTLAFELVAAAPHVPAEVGLSCVAELAQAAGPRGMCAGQVMDMQASPVHPEEALRVYQLKTGALIRAAVRMGARVGGAKDFQLAALTRYAEQLGEAFQLVDDLLDLSGSFESLGKTPGKDLVQQKRTYPALAGIEETRSRAQLCLQNALEALQMAQLEAPEDLEAIAYSLVERSA